MEYEKIKQLMDDMGNSKLTSIDIDFPDGTKIRMKKQSNQEVEKTIISSTTDKVNDMQNINMDIKEEKEIEKNPKTGNIIKSPIVGTFYTKPSPTAQPYVEIGKDVKKGDVVCIIEAMKLMNEIESEYDGKIDEIFVKDGEPVEYGQELFKIV